MATGSRGQLISLTTLDEEATSGAGYMNASLFKLDTDVFLVIYKYSTTIVGVKACTFSVGEGGLGCQVIDKKVISPTDKNFNGNDFRVCKARANVYAVTYRVTGYLMYCSSFYVSPSGSIGSIDTIVVGGSNSIWPAIASDGSSYVLCGYWHSDHYDYFKSYKVESNGDIASTPTDYEVVYISHSSREVYYISKIRSNVYAAIYEDHDGVKHLRTFYMNSGSITYIADINLDTMLDEQGSDYFLLEPIANTAGLCLLCYRAGAGTGRFVTFTISSSGVVSSVIEKINCIHGYSKTYHAVEIAANTIAISYREDTNNWGVVEWIDITSAGDMTHTDYVEIHEESVTTIADPQIDYKGNLVIAYILEQDLKVAIMKCLDIPGTTPVIIGDRVTGIVIREGPGVYSDELYLGGLDTRFFIDYSKEPQPVLADVKYKRVLISTGNYEFTETGMRFYDEYREADGTITRHYWN